MHACSHTDNARACSYLQKQRILALLLVSTRHYNVRMQLQHCAVHDGQRFGVACKYALTPLPCPLLWSLGTLAWLHTNSRRVFFNLSLCMRLLLIHTGEARFKLCISIQKTGETLKVRESGYGSEASLVFRAPYCVFSISVKSENHQYLR